PFLIRWTAAFLDNGYSYWPMDQRERGYFHAMLHHLSHEPIAKPWLKGIALKAKSLIEGKSSAINCIQECLETLGVEQNQAREYLVKTLLALPGWAGMFEQLKVRPDLVPGRCPPTELCDFLAVRLLLEEFACLNLYKGRPAKPSEKKLLKQLAGDEKLHDSEYCDLTSAWLLFQISLLLGLTERDWYSMKPKVCEQFIDLLNKFDELKRRSFWQLAYERRYRVSILDALLAHQKTLAKQRKAPSPIAQIVTCIDDREESLRRHIEELNPAYETYGVAAFFGVATYFRPLHYPMKTPLCPPTIVPKHLIEEHVDKAELPDWESRDRREKLWGKLSEFLSVGSRTLARGSLLSLWGAGTIIPLFTRLVAPSFHSRLFPQKSPVPTKLAIDWDKLNPEKDGLQLGYKTEEMVDIVASTLSTMGLTEFAPLVLILGHGSSSANNPHDAAYDCGACGGGSGAPNARAFAMMANREEVRQKLKERGIDIPNETYFVGGHHNTCDDSIDCFDLALMPESHKEQWTALAESLDEARCRDAQERCRRFLSVPEDVTPREALLRVENRSRDLAQPRPELGHATNALCLVGRRAWSRGLFLDRRVFLTSYNPAIDQDHSLLSSLLASVGPVGAGINLEYYFSYVDSIRYGSGTKLPHNVTGLLGVMDGHQSDLRTGLPWQMVEIHEPMRLLNIIEGTPEILGEVLESQPGLKQLVENGWILVAAFDPDSNRVWFYEKGEFQEHDPEKSEIEIVSHSVDWFRGRRGDLKPVSVCPKEVGRGQS
ncbi:MAG: Na-translocating system protein MpsB, partial [Planctomycetota bacterium]|nr:Na-translocating system protein MpsB [Planctomycetota bacterium]